MTQRDAVSTSTNALSPVSTYTICCIFAVQQAVNIATPNWSVYSKSTTSPQQIELVEFGFRLTLIQTLNLTRLLVNLTLTLTITSALTVLISNVKLCPRKVKSHWKWNLNVMNEPACRAYRAALTHLPTQPPQP